MHMLTVLNKMTSLFMRFIAQLYLSILMDNTAYVCFDTDIGIEIANYHSLQ